MARVTFDGGEINKRGVALSDAIGRNIVCEDGIMRKVHHIVYAQGYKDRAIINEMDPDSRMGHFVHLLSLSCQIMGQPLPTREQKEAFTRYTKALYYEETPDEQANRWLKVLSKLQKM